VTVEKVIDENSMYALWQVRGMRLTYTQTTGKVTSCELNVTHMPFIPLGSSFISDLDSFRLTSAEDCMDTITAFFHYLQVGLHSTDGNKTKMLRPRPRLRPRL